MLRYHTVPVTPFQQNASIVFCEATRQAAVIDPGGDIDRILEFLEKEQLTLAKILVTHGHIDHAGATGELAERYQLPIEGPQKEERFWIDQLDNQGRMFGVPGARRFTP